MTQQQQHTSGPWHTAGEQGVQIRSAKDQIAKVWTMRGNEWKANARLISASPDLLDALTSLLWYVDQLEMIIYSSDDKGIHEEVEKARKAIEKATGESTW